MADIEFEEFRQYFETLPQHIGTSAQNYMLVHDVGYEEDSSTQLPNRKQYPEELYSFSYEENSLEFIETPEDINYSPKRQCKNLNDRRRRKFSDSPKKTTYYDAKLDKKFKQEIQFSSGHDATNNQSTLLPYLIDGVYSSDSEFCDSGNSTAHSPDESTVPNSSLVSADDDAFIHLNVLEATHRALHRFIARHSDEIELEIGDPIYVQKEAEDLWCEEIKELKFNDLFGKNEFRRKTCTQKGINLKNGHRGIFPSAYVVDVDYNDFDPSSLKTKRERFLLSYLGSVETLFHKGNSVLCQAVQKITSMQHECHSCILEVSDSGIRMYDKSKPNKNKETTLTLDYFYSLKNVSFCGFHPQDSQYMGFITKHPNCDRFACHVFQSDGSTRPVTESIGRAFHRFYQKYIETAYPTEDIYIE